MSAKLGDHNSHHSGVRVFVSYDTEQDQNNLRQFGASP